MKAIPEKRKIRDWIQFSLLIGMIFYYAYYESKRKDHLPNSNQITINNSKPNTSNNKHTLTVPLTNYFYKIYSPFIWNLEIKP
jgi:hypothetical protein